MKILQVTNFFKPAWDTGGVTRSSYEISKSLVQSGNKVTVYTTDGGKNRLSVKKNKPVMVDGIKTFYFRNISNTLARPYNITTPYYLPFVARKEIKDFDVIHIHEHRTLLAAIVSHYARKYDVPYVVQPRGSLGHHGSKVKLKNLFDKIAGDKILESPSKVLALTEKEKNDIYQSGIPISKIVVLPNGISTDQLNHEVTNGKFREKFNISEKNIVLYLGRLSPIKGLDLLLDSFNKLDNGILEETKLVLVGPDDGMKDKLINKSEKYGLDEKIIFTGPLYGKDKLQAYTDSTVYVLPSIYEAFPNTVLEAGYTGLPVLMSENCTLADMLSDNDVAVVFERKTDILAQTISLILKDSTERKRLGKDINKFVKNNFIWDEVIKEYVKTYKEINNIKT